MTKIGYVSSSATPQYIREQAGIMLDYLLGRLLRVDPLNRNPHSVLMVELGRHDELFANRYSRGLDKCEFYVWVDPAESDRAALYGTPRNSIDFHVRVRLISCTMPGAGSLNTSRGQWTEPEWLDVVMKMGLVASPRLGRTLRVTGPGPRLLLEFDKVAMTARGTAHYIINLVGKYPIAADVVVKRMLEDLLDDLATGKFPGLYKDVSTTMHVLADRLSELGQAPLEATVRRLWPLAGEAAWCKETES